jgi:hypothetical protein
MALSVLSRHVVERLTTNWSCSLPSRTKGTIVLGKITLLADLSVRACGQPYAVGLCASAVGELRNGLLSRIACILSIRMYSTVNQAGNKDARVTFVCTLSCRTMMRLGHQKSVATVIRCCDDGTYIENLTRGRARMYACFYFEPQSELVSAVCTAAWDVLLHMCTYGRDSVILYVLFICASCHGNQDF